MKLLQLTHRRTRSRLKEHQYFLVLACKFPSNEIWMLPIDLKYIILSGFFHSGHEENKTDTLTDNRRASYVMTKFEAGKEHYTLN